MGYIQGDIREKRENRIKEKDPGGIPKFWLRHHHAISSKRSRQDEFNGINKGHHRWHECVTLVV
jgi:hypothetical protein